MSQCLDVGKFVGKNYVEMVVHCLSLQVAKIHAKKEKNYIDRWITIQVL